MARAKEKSKSRDSQMGLVYDRSMPSNFYCLITILSSIYRMLWHLSMMRHYPLMAESGLDLYS